MSTLPRANGGRPISATPGTVLGVLSLLFWSTSIAFGRQLTEHVGIITASSTAFLLSGGVTCLYWSIRFRSPRPLLQHRPAYLWGCGGAFALYIVCLYTAVGSAANRQQVLEVGLINYLWPALMLLFSGPILGYQVRATLWPGVALAVGGAILAVSGVSGQNGFSWASWQQNGPAHFGPYLLALLGAVAWALYSNLSRRFGPQQGTGAVPVFVLGTGLLLFLLRGVVHEQPHWTPEALGFLVYVSLFPITLAYAFWDYAMRTGRVVLLASLSYFAPIASTLFSALILGLTPGVTLWMGCGFVVVGALICRHSVEER